jgi:hypothetical protein
MKKTGNSLLAAAAITGLINGAAIRQTLAAPTNSAAAGTNAPAPGKVAPLATAPKEHDCAGDNECKGVGGCKTDAHACKFKNDCKGKGGCHVTKQDIKDWEKAQKVKKSKDKTKDTNAAPAKTT